MRLGENLRSVRKSWGESQAEFGARFDVSKTAVSKWEMGDSEPPLKVLIWMEEQTGVSIRSLALEALEVGMIGSRPGDKRDFEGQERVRMKSKIGDLVMRLEDSEREMVRVYKALETVIGFLEKNMDKSVYEKEKKEYVARLSAILDK